MSKRLVTALIFCFLSLAVLSNRFFVLRQFAVRFSQNASFELPVDDTTPSQTGGRTLLIAVPNEGVFDLQQPSLDAIGIKTDARSALQSSGILVGFQADVSSRPPAYILQSVLNL